MTRREWLKENPPPEALGELIKRAEQLEAKGDAAAGMKMREQAACGRVGKCLIHPFAPLYRHRNRMEDLFTCSQGQHALLWTLVQGRAQLVPVDLSRPLPDLDAQMPESA
jgi:hypothetical protein